MQTGKQHKMNHGPNSNFKTSKCQYYERGFCKNQQNCQFAHGEQELRSFNNNINNNIKINNAEYQEYQQLQDNDKNNNQIQEQQMFYPSIEQIRLQAMIEIVQNVSKILIYDNEAYNKLQQATQFILANQQDQANLIVQEVMNDPKRTQDEIQQYSFFFQQTAEFMQHHQQQILQSQFIQQQQSMQQQQQL